MIPVTYNFEVLRGDTFDLGFSLDDDEGAGIDLSSFTATMHLRTSIDATEYVDWSSYFSAPDENGDFSLGVTAAASSALTAGQYVYDIQLANGDDSSVNTYVGGRITVLEDVTR